MAIDFEPLTDAPKIDFEPESSPAAPQIDFQPESSPIAVTAEPDMPTSDAGPAPAPRAQEDLNFATAAEDTIDANIIGAIAGTADILKDTFSIPGTTAGRPSDQLDYDVLLKRRKQIESDLQSGNLNAAQVEGHARALEQLNYRIGQLANSPRSETFGGQLGQAAQAYRESAQRVPGAAGAIARGVGNVAAAVPLTIGTGGTGLALATAQQVGSAESAARTQTEQQLKAAGVPEKEAEAMAQFAGTEEALKAAVTMPAYLLGGKVASGATAALIGENASPLLRAAVGTVGATAANLGTGSAIRAIEGEPAAPTWETATQDVLWGIVHGAGEFAHASEAQKVRALDEIAKRKVDVVENQTITGEPNAVTQQSPAQIHGDVLNPEGTSQSTGEVPPNESSPGVPPRGQGEIVARNAPSETQQIVPAIRVGDEVVKGNPGETHQDILNRFIAEHPEQEADAIMGFDSKQNPNFFIDGQGNELSRDQLEEKFGVRDSQRLRELQQKEASPVAPEASVPAPPERNLGPGAANIEEFVPPPEIGAWNAKVDEQRAARGLPPLASEARKPDPVLWDTTMGKIEREVIKPEEIVNDVLSNKKKIATDEEQTALLYRMVDLHNKLDTEAQRYLDPSNNDAERAEAKLNYDRLERDFQRTEEADRKVGTEQGRALRARRLIADENYNLVGIMRRLSMAKGEGKPITPEEVQKAKEGAAAVKTAADELEEVTARGPVDESIRQIEEEAKKNPEFIPQVRSLADRIIERLDRAGKAAHQRLRGLLSQLGSAPDVGKTAAIVKEFSIMAASDIAKGVLKFGQWATKMVGEFGEKVKPYLGEAWAGANKHIDDQVNATTKPKDRKAVKEAVTKEKTTATADTIAEGMKDKKPEELRSSVHKLMETLVRAGVKGREPLVDAVHERLKEVDQTISRRQTMDLMSGYGNLKKLNPDAVKAEVRDIKQQLQLVAKIQDVQAKIPLKKSGVERQALSDESRRLTQELNENIRKLGVVVSDPQTQLKTILAAQETRLTNRIKDLRQEIADGERRVKTKTQAQTNEKIEILKKELAQVQAEHEKVFGTKEKTSEQKLAAAIAAAKRAEAVENARLEKAKKGIFEKPVKTSAQKSAELDAIKARTEAARAERKALEDAANPPLSDAQKALDKALVARERWEQLLAGEIAPAKKMTPEALSDLEDDARTEIAAMRELAAQLRKDARPKKAEPTPDELEANKAQQRLNQALNEKARLEGIASGEITPTKPIPKEALSQLEEDTRLEIESLRNLIAEQNKKPARDPHAVKEEAQIKALEKAAAEFERRVNEADFSGRGKKQGPDTERVAKARALRDAAKTAFDAAKEAASPKVSPEQRKINAILASLTRRTADLQAKAAAGDFTKPPPRKASPITPEILKARAKLEEAKTVIDRGIEKERLKNRTFLEKSADLLAKWTRASILSGPITLAKLTTAAAYRVAAIPAEEAAGSALRKLFPRAAARAPYEGRGLEPRLEAQSIAKGVTRGLMDAWNTVKSGKGQLDTALGKRDIAPRSLLDIFGAIHGALKAPVKRVFFERSMAKRVRSAAEAGVDVTDPAIQVQIAADAYKDAQRSIFMQDNKVASLVSQTAARLEAPNKNTGRPSTLGKAGATALRIALPVVKVPTNIVAEIFQHVFGLPYGLGKLAREYARGIEKLHPDEADAIFRSMKKGSLGTAMLLYGFFASNQFGGQYAPGLKKKENEAGFGEMKVGGAKVPKFLIHNPLLETAQVGATIRHVMDQKIKGKTQGLMTGIGRGLLGAVEEAPQFDEAVRLSHLTEQNGPTKYFGELARSVAIPQLVQQIARWTDAQKRKPETITDYLKEGIPGARETLPVRR